LELRLPGLGRLFQGPEFRVNDSWFRFYGFGFRVSGFGFRVEGVPWSVVRVYHGIRVEG